MSKVYNSAASHNARHSSTFNSRHDIEMTNPVRPLHTAAHAAPLRVQNRNLYWKLSDALGFKEKYSLLCFIVFGGSMLGFCLSRLMMFSPHNVEHRTVPGEWFWYRQPLYKPNILIHVYLTTIACFLTGIQFLPAFQTEQWMTFHRINGWAILILLIPGNIAGAIVARHAFGGSVNTQTAFYAAAGLIMFSTLVGMSDFKEPGLHRRWMLRTISYLGAIITARVIRHIAGELITHIGNYYSIWTCDEIKFVLGPESPIIAQEYASCLDGATYTVVRASVDGSPVEYGSAVRCSFGMAIWVSLVLHAIGVEIYIRYTPITNRVHNGAPHQYVGNELQHRADQKH